MITISFKNKLVPAFLALLRILIGWHFLYEGLIKLFDPAWTARPFLEGSRWIFGDLFRWMASGDTGMWIIDKANAFGLTITGLALMLGFYTRIASWIGVTMLLMYYLAYPPFGGFSYGTLSEGNYLLVNKNLIELFTLILLGLTQSGRFFGFDMLRNNKIFRAPEPETKNVVNQVIPESNRRRELLKGLAGLPFLAGFGGVFIRSITDNIPDAVSGATNKVVYKQLKEINGKLPEGRIGDLKMTRLIMGCNLIGGWSHARDLLYTNTLFKAYNNERKIIETLYLAEQAGINATFMVTPFYPTLNKYKSIYNGKMQSICQAMLPDKDFFSDVKLAIDSGATALYIQGGEGDRYVSSGKIDMVYKAIDYIKKQGFLAGVGGHSLETFRVCEKEGIPADFYVKTFHHDNYWSAHPPENRVEFSVIGDYSPDHNKYHDNIWDLFPAQTVDFMKEVKKPWIAFKVLAAGALQPKDGFRFAFENGADFICVGMFDFQIVEDVNIANEVLGSLGKRDREWRS
jgi:uncharacterized membrane protein YphA (DoxX/SURF4 family)